MKFRSGHTPKQNTEFRIHDNFQFWPLDCARSRLLTSDFLFCSCLKQLTILTPFNIQLTCIFLTSTTSLPSKIQHRPLIDMDKFHLIYTRWAALSSRKIFRAMHTYFNAIKQNVIASKYLRAYKAPNQIEGRMRYSCFVAKLTSQSSISHHFD